MEKLLVVERAYGNGSWALYDGRDRIACGLFGAGLPRAPEWFADVVAGLSAAGVAPQSLDVLLAGTGPGSFSGIRSVLAALQGLALPRGIPVLGLSSAAAIARAATQKHGADVVAVVGDARRGTLWSAVYGAPEAGSQFLVPGSRFSVPGSRFSVPSSQFLVPDTNPSTLQPFNLSTPAELPQAIPQGALVVSPEYTHLAPVLSALKGVRVVDEDVISSAEDLADLYFSNPAAAVRDPLPIYLHPAVVTR
jgi:tRNA threonylcarbamoyl adenosine modification protein YeaZ